MEELAKKMEKVYLYNYQFIIQQLPPPMDRDATPEECVDALSKIENIIAPSGITLYIMKQVVKFTYTHQKEIGMFIY